MKWYRAELAKENEFWGARQVGGRAERETEAGTGRDLGQGSRGGLGHTGENA